MSLMSTVTASDLEKVSNFDQLVELLRDGLEWPIDEDIGFDDVVFEYEADELGLKKEEIAKIREIHQLRPLATNQPWGIFFISMEDKAIPVTVLRRILKALVFKKRGSAQTAERRAWDKSDMIFATRFGEVGARELAFIHFSDGKTAGDLPVMKVLGWNARDTRLHNEYVARLLGEKLAWPDDPDDSDQWRQTWASAFELRLNETITTSKALAIQLAALASDIRARVNQLLNAEVDTGPMRTMLAAFQKNLIHDLDDDGFADMFAQTICYGMLAARISRPMGIVADNLADMVPRTNPFLKELFASFLHIGGRHKRSGLDFDELGIRDVVDVLNDANMEAVLRDFGDRNPKEDPVIHFYELFLKEYDSEKRMQRGVFYTPRPVVNFIVRGVDEVLRTEFGLPLGLADTSTWTEVAARNDGITIPAHVQPDAPFVQILDPATGTGTFLVEVIDLIHRRMEEHWKAQGKSATEVEIAWNDYVPKHLLPRLTAFELMMAPYTIAHMKVGLKLSETGYTFGSDERARIFLTNALEPARDLETELSFISEALAHEAKASNTAKRESPFTIVIGNPPYANYSANLGPGARSLVDRYRHFRSQPIKERNQLQFERNIQDDYVKFLSVAQTIIEKSECGIVSFITNGVLLSSSSLRGVREDVWDNFDPIYEINLHGGTNERFEGSEQDQNVFDIAQMVAIHCYVRTDGRRSKELKYIDFKGSREEKYRWLLEFSMSSVRWNELKPDRESLSFLVNDECSVKFKFRTDEVFVQFGAGIKTNRDSIVIDFDGDNLLQRAIEYSPRFRTVSQDAAPIFDLQYRPFDYRKIFFHKDIVKSRSLPTMQHMLIGENIGLIASSTWTTPERFSVLVSSCMVEMKTGTHDRGTTFFPLYRFESVLAGEPKKVHNLAKVFVSDWKDVTGLDFISTGSGDGLQSTGPDDVLSWLYFLFHSSRYRETFMAALSRGFPIVLLPATSEVLRRSVLLGRQLIALHSFDTENAPILKVPDVRFAGSGEARIKTGFPKYENGKVIINDSRWFEDVPKETWEFHVGGYQVCRKWLKDRAAKGGKNPSPGRVLTEKDILHYRRTVVALTETRRLMAEIDRVIEAHGGWPGAFYQPPPPPPTVEEIIKADESRELEFKSTFQWDIRKREKNKSLQKEVLKTLAAFMNTDGGTLVIGVTDDKEIIGLENDLNLVRGSKDEFENLLFNVAQRTIGAPYIQHCKLRIVDATEGKKVCVIEVARSNEPVFVEFDGKHEYFVRRGNATASLNARDQYQYMQERSSSARGM
jgi:hypothetical protein